MKELGTTALVSALCFVLRTVFQRLSTQGPALCLSTEEQVGWAAGVITEPCFMLSPLLWLHDRS